MGDQNLDANYANLREFLFNHGSRSRGTDENDAEVVLRPMNNPKRTKLRPLLGERKQVRASDTLTNSLSPQRPPNRQSAIGNRKS